MATKQLERKKIYDSIQRLIHAWIGLLVLGLIVLGLVSRGMEPGAAKQGLEPIHLIFGYGLAVGLVARMVWGVLGPHHARLSQLWRPADWVARLKGPQRAGEAGFGHHPFACLVYIMFYAGLLLSIVSGLALAGIEQDRGPLAALLFDELRWQAMFLWVHEAMLYFMIVFVLVHISAIIRHEETAAYPVAQSMLSGYQYRPVSSEETHED